MGPFLLAQATHTHYYDRAHFVDTSRSRRVPPGGAHVLGPQVSVGVQVENGQAGVDFQLGLHRPDGNRMLAAQYPHQPAVSGVVAHRRPHPLHHFRRAAHVGLNRRSGMDAHLRNIQIQLGIVILKTVRSIYNGARPITGAAPEGGSAVVGDRNQDHSGLVQLAILRREGQKVRGHPRKIARLRHGTDLAVPIPGQFAVPVLRPSPAGRRATPTPGPITRSWLRPVERVS